MNSPQIFNKIKNAAPEFFDFPIISFPSYKIAKKVLNNINNYLVIEQEKYIFKEILRNIENCISIDPYCENYLNNFHNFIIKLIKKQ